ncbi:MAG TPA: GAF domain-containing protein, partial [Thermoanaerobaculia bacterium]|nr:GAF domain-containing protein [Thermoanaerobaculia bacterium]
MHPDVDELRPKLKEILYDCAVEIKATKAALYLLDPSIRKFELVTEYGFRSAIPQSANWNHPLVDRAARGRTPFFVNSVGADPKLSELLFAGASERLLVAPLFSRGELIGLIDMRDKAGKASFEQPDVSKAQTIAEKILNVFATKNLFNQRFITLADVDISGLAKTEPMPALVPEKTDSAAEPASAPKKAKAKPAPKPPAPEPSGPSHTLPVQDIIAESRNKAAKIVLPPPSRKFGEGELRAVRDVLHSILYLPGSLVAAFTMTAGGGGVQEIAAKNTLSGEARDALQLKLQTWL